MSLACTAMKIGGPGIFIDREHVCFGTELNCFYLCSERLLQLSTQQYFPVRKSPGRSCGNENARIEIPATIRDWPMNHLLRPKTPLAILNLKDLHTIGAKSCLGKQNLRKFKMVNCFSHGRSSGGMVCHSSRSFRLRVRFQCMELT